MSGAAVLAVPTPQLAAWRPELVLLATALATALATPAPELWRRPLRLLTVAGLALALGAAWAALPVAGAEPLGPHFVLDDGAALVRLTVLAMTLLVVLTDRIRDPRAGGMLALATLGLDLLAQAATLTGLLVAVAMAVLGSSLSAWYAARGEGRVAAVQWLAASALGFGVLSFGAVLACGLAGSLELAAVPAALAARASLPPVALPLLMSLVGAGFALAVLGEPGRFAVSGRSTVAAVHIGWITLAPPLAVTALLRRLVTGAEPGPATGVAPLMTAALAAVLVLLGFAAAAAQPRLERRLAWAALGQAGLALLGFAAPPVAGSVSTPLLLLLAMVPAHLGAMLLADALERRDGRWRWREPQLLLLFCMLVSLAALPPLVSWRPRIELLANLHAAEQRFALGVAAGGTLLAIAVYLWPLVTLWRRERAGGERPGAADWSPLAPTLLAAALLGLVLAWSLGLVDPAAALR